MLLTTTLHTVPAVALVLVALVVPALLTKLVVGDGEHGATGDGGRDGAADGLGG